MPVERITEEIFHEVEHSNSILCSVDSASGARRDDVERRGASTG